MKLRIAGIAALALAWASFAEAATYKLYQNMINDTITAACPLDTGDPAVGVAGIAFTAESTAVFNVGDFTNVGMFLRVIPAAGDTATAIRLAIQVRAHTSFDADSTNTFSWHLWNAAATAGLPDTMRNGYTTYNPPAGEGCGVWGGEVIVTMTDPTRGRGNMRSNQFFGAPNGLFIPLTSRTGPRFSAPYMSIRVRVLSGADKPRVTLHVGLIR